MATSICKIKRIYGYKRFSHWEMGENFEFTGRIKYLVYPKDITVFFEISYKEYSPRGFWEDLKYLIKTLDIKGIFTHRNYVEKTEWLAEKAFYFVDKPEEIIYTCSTN